MKTWSEALAWIIVTIMGTILGTILGSVISLGIIWLCENYQDRKEQEDAAASRQSRQQQKLSDCKETLDRFCEKHSERTMVATRDDVGQHGTPYSGDLR
jgi:uncharacterized membrane protein YhiD involved in acid resistance